MWTAQQFSGLIWAGALVLTAVVIEAEACKWGAKYWSCHSIWPRSYVNTIGNFACMNLQAGQRPLAIILKLTILIASTYTYTVVILKRVMGTVVTYYSRVLLYTLYALFNKTVYYILYV